MATDAGRPVPVGQGPPAGDRGLPGRADLAPGGRRGFHGAGRVWSAGRWSAASARSRTANCGCTAASRSCCCSSATCRRRAHRVRVPPGGHVSERCRLLHQRASARENDWEDLGQRLRVQVRRLHNTLNVLTRCDKRIWTEPASPLARASATTCAPSASARGCGWS